MSDRNNAGSQSADSRLRVLLAAERLFAEQGVEGTSLRKIAVAAKNGNNNAVQYYFKSRDGLITEIFHHRIAQMENRRAVMLEHARQAGLDRDLHYLVEIFCLPLLDLVEPDGTHTYANFLLQYLSRYSTNGMGEVIDDVLNQAPALAETVALMREVTGCPPPVIQSRIVLCHLMFVTMLVRASRAPGLSLDSDAFALLVQDTLSMIVVSLSAPLSGEQRAAPRSAVPATITLGNKENDTSTLRQENVRLKMLVADLSLENIELQNRLRVETT